MAQRKPFFGVHISGFGVSKIEHCVLKRGIMSNRSSLFTGEPACHPLGINQNEQRGAM
jgi:hypothetical protein